MLSILSVKEAVILSLRLGLVNEEYFPIPKIAEFLSVSEEEIKEITVKALVLYKDKLNSIIDAAINVKRKN